MHTNNSYCILETYADGRDGLHHNRSEREPVFFCTPGAAAEAIAELLPGASKEYPLPAGELAPCVTRVTAMKVIRVRVQITPYESTVFQPQFQFERTSIMVTLTAPEDTAVAAPGPMLESSTAADEAADMLDAMEVESELDDSQGVAVLEAFAIGELPADPQAVAEKADFDAAFEAVAESQPAIGEAAPATATADATAADQPTPGESLHRTGWAIGNDDPANKPAATTDTEVIERGQTQAEYEVELQEAQDAHTAAAVEHARIEGDLKCAKKEVKQALDKYMRVQARGPRKDIVKSVSKSKSSDETDAADLPDSLDDSPANSTAHAIATDDAWRAVPLTELDLSSIKGLGKKKRETLLEVCPTIGALEDLRAKAGAQGLQSVLPDGFGEKVSSEIEEAMIRWLTANRDSHLFAGQGGASEAVAVEAAVETQPAEESIQEKLSALGESFHTEPAAPALPTAAEWEALNDTEQGDYLIARAAAITDSGVALRDPIENGHWSSGRQAYGQGAGRADCPYVPGQAQDDWLRGWLFASQADVEPEVGEAPGEVAEAAEAEVVAVAEPLEEAAEAADDSPAEQPAEELQLVGAGAGAGATASGIELVSLDDL